MSKRTKKGSYKSHGSSSHNRKGTSGVSPERKMSVQHYCLAFLDLLGQKNAMEGQALIPHFGSSEEMEAFRKAVIKSAGTIRRLQERSRLVVEGMMSQSDPLRPFVPPEKLAVWDESKVVTMREQRWSDGLVYFHSLSDGRRFPARNILALFIQAGAMIFLGLANKSPLRGAIDIAWGVELQPGEIYGAVVARAAVRESQCAKYPRIIISDTVSPFLNHLIETAGGDDVSQINRVMATRCSEMIYQDGDGQLTLHYLSPMFRRSLTASQFEALYKSAFDFIEEQIAQHSASNNNELFERYQKLKDYFLKFPPSYTD